MYELTELEAMRAMLLLVDAALERGVHDIEALVSEVTAGPEGSVAATAAWPEWLRCVRAIKGGPDVPIRVRYADGQTIFCASIEEARLTVARRASHTIPPRGILPAEIAELNPAEHPEPKLLEQITSN